MNKVLVYTIGTKLPQKLATELTGINFLVRNSFPRELDCRQIGATIIYFEQDCFATPLWSQCAVLKERMRSKPIFVVGTFNTAQDILPLYQAGIDLYISINQDTRLFQAQLKALLGRAGIVATPRISVANITIDEERYAISSKKMEIPLRKREFEILKLLARKPGRVFTRAQINEATRSVWHETNDETIDVHISNLRKALGSLCKRELITTVYGVGYKLRC